jgi:branched-chain amino acid transport system permease protein
MSLIVAILSTTATLVPLVVAMNLLFRVSGVANFGAGHFCVFAGAAAANFGAKGALLGAVSALALSVVASLAAYGVAILPARRAKVPPIGLTISTLGFGLLLGWLTDRLFGGDPQNIQPWVDGTVTLLGTGVAIQRLIVIGAATMFLVVLYGIFDRTLIGKTLSAVSQDRGLAEMYGVRSRRYELLAWVVGGVGLGLGGLFQASLASVSVDVAPKLLVLTFVAAVIGGLGSLAGSVGGALVLACATSLTSALGIGGRESTAAFVVLAAVLVVRPRGLFGSGAVGERV